MAIESDRQALEDAGIKDIDQLVANAAAFLRDYPLQSAPLVANALSEGEEAFLRAGGARGVSEAKGAYVSDNVAILAGEFAQMVSTALSQKEVATLLGVGTSRVRQRLDAGDLYSVRTNAGRVCPRFQFGADGALPGLETVLAALRVDVHPVAILRFFMARHPDLESDTLKSSLSPRDWLLTGHSAEVVAGLIREL